MTVVAEPNHTDRRDKQQTVACSYTQCRSGRSGRVWVNMLNYRKTDRGLV